MMKGEEARAAALAAYDNGYMPLPLRTEEGARKRPALATWRQYQNERPSRETVEQMFDGDFNLGIITGRVSGIVVVDLDGEIENVPDWAQKHQLYASTPIVHTGGGGGHLYFRHPGTAIANGVKLATVDGISIDVRADGGYVVAPPSVHDNGCFYEWAHGGWDSVVSMMPPALETLLRRQVEGDKTGALLASDFLGNGDMHRLLEGVGRGERNQAAARVSGYWLKVCRGDQQAAWQALQIWNVQNTPPLSEVELRTTFQSIARREEKLDRWNEDTTAPEQSDSVVLLDGPSWAESVRNAPPRHGVPIRSLPGIEELGGLVPRDLVILAGRPGMGKSTAAWGVVVEACLKQKVPTVIFSTEMTATDVARWMGSFMFKKPVPELKPNEWDTTLKRIAAAPVTMCDVGSMTVDRITEVVRARPETRLVIVDHIQRINGGSYGDNRNLEVGRTAQMLKSLAKDTPCCVLALSQMNRASDTMTRPRLGALRDSGEIEQEADAVMFLWSRQEDLTVPELDVEFYLAKNRHGALASKQATFRKALKRFELKGIDAELRKIADEHARMSAVRAACNET